MMARNRQQSAATSNEEVYLWGGVLALVVLLLVVPWVALHVAARVEGVPAPASNPMELLAGLFKGEYDWTTTATIVAIVVVVFVGGLVGLMVWGVVYSKRNNKDIDSAARYMARPRHYPHLTEAGAKAKAARLGVQATGAVGLPLGKVVGAGKWLYSSWEDLLVLIAGPRTQKTTAYAIPQVLAAPGACLATSNKRDVKDATQGVREKMGRCWAMDPQGVSGEPAGTWWYPILGYVTSPAKAEKLAAQLTTSARTPGARTDAYFDAEAENLIGLLLLAAATAKEEITKVYSWLTRPTDEEPVRALKSGGYSLHAESLFALCHLPDKQREGVFGSARALMGWLRNEEITRWVTQPYPNAPTFNPTNFVRSTDTLYLLSREGEGAAGPVIAAMTVAILEAGQEYARISPGGRMPVPMVGILDEAANICRIKDLDSHYSYFGSLGIILTTILQSWAQGEEVWGDKGMEKLFSAANVKIYGGGVDDDKFLRRVSDLIGTYDEVMTAESISKGDRNKSRSIQERTIASLSQLRELPQGRAVLFASGTPALLMEPVPWFRSTRRAEVQTSIDKYDPSKPSAPVLASADTATPAIVPTPPIIVDPVVSVGVDVSRWQLQPDPMPKDSVIAQVPASRWEIGPT